MKATNIVNNSHKEAAISFLRLASSDSFLLSLPLKFFLSFYVSGEAKKPVVSTFWRI
jgi:hypothetical protein